MDRCGPSEAPLDDVEQADQSRLGERRGTAHDPRRLGNRLDRLVDRLPPEVRWETVHLGTHQRPAPFAVDGEPASRPSPPLGNRILSSRRNEPIASAGAIANAPTTNIDASQREARRQRSPCRGIVPPNGHADPHPLHSEAEPGSERQRDERLEVVDAPRETLSQWPVEQAALTSSYTGPTDAACPNVTATRPTPKAGTEEQPMRSATERQSRQSDRGDHVRWRRRSPGSTRSAHPAGHQPGPK